MFLKNFKTKKKIMEENAILKRKLLVKSSLENKNDVEFLDFDEINTTFVFSDHINIKYDFLRKAMAKNITEKILDLIEIKEEKCDNNQTKYIATLKILNER